MHHFEPNLDDDQCSLDRIKTDEQDAFRIAIYCEQNHKNVLDKSRALHNSYRTCSLSYNRKLS